MGNGTDVASSNPWTDHEQVPDRQPHACPYCGTEGGPFDGQGHFRTAGRVWARVRCPDCDFPFMVVHDPDA